MVSLTASSLKKYKGLPALWIYYSLSPHQIVVVMSFLWSKSGVSHENHLCTDWYIIHWLHVMSTFIIIIYCLLLWDVLCHEVRWNGLFWWDTVFHRGAYFWFHQTHSSIIPMFETKWNKSLHFTDECTVKHVI